VVESSLRALVSAADPTAFAHHLERKAYHCNWSHRVRSNLLLVFGVSKGVLTFLSVGTHAQAYRPKP
jgi:mRNA-degrading endonuclease YafQ of YafQ-DinJ toxin-antitoxin module